MEEFGKYLLVDRLAQGGMAEVFRAQLMHADTVLHATDKWVALKRILPFLADSSSEFTTMFIDEARISASLSHENIAQVFEFGEVKGIYYLAMELVEGTDLGRLHAGMKKLNRLLPPVIAAKVVAEAARGLDYAHHKEKPDGTPLGLIHRDVSPPNILISYAGEVKIADFGIAKAIGKLHKTDAGTLVGKIRYMSPEQVNGEPLDPRSDIFALGSVLYELLTGASPFSGKNPGTLAEQIRDAAVAPPRERVDTVPPTLDAICLRALARDREARFREMSELASELDAFVTATAPLLSHDDLGRLVREIVPPPPVAGTTPVAPLLDTAQPPQAAPLSDAAGPPVPADPVAGSLGAKSLHALPSHQRTPWVLLAVLGLVAVISGALLLWSLGTSPR